MKVREVLDPKEEAGGIGAGSCYSGWRLESQVKKGKAHSKSSSGSGS